MAREKCYPHIPLTLYQPLGHPIEGQVAKVTTTWKNRRLSECRLRIQVSWQSYQEIELQSLFNFDAELQTAVSQELLPGLEVEITALLAPHLLSALGAEISSAETVVPYLQGLVYQDTETSLLSVKNWLGLVVKQRQQQGEVSYRTLWDYLDWSVISRQSSSEIPDHLLMEATVKFSKDNRFKHSLINSVGTDHLQIGDQLSEALLTLIPNISSHDERDSSKLIDGFTKFFREFLETSLSSSLTELTIPELSSQQIQKPNDLFNSVAQFFQQEEWTGIRLENQTILQLQFQGKNERWHCYAQTRETEQQFIFYSILPVNIPQKNRHKISEFLARVNYGLFVGNFEMDFSDGEVRYKTSLSVEGSALDLALIRQIVCGNVLIMDKYLPGIQQVLEGRPPTETIAHIESQYSEGSATFA